MELGAQSKGLGAWGEEHGTKSMGHGAWGKELGAESKFLIYGMDFHQR